jgi:hypothetical protein
MQNRTYGQLPARSGQISEPESASSGYMYRPPLTG